MDAWHPKSGYTAGLGRIEAGIEPHSEQLAHPVGPSLLEIPYARGLALEPDPFIECDGPRDGDTAGRRPGAHIFKTADIFRKDRKDKLPV